MSEAKEPEEGLPNPLDERNNTELNAKHPKALLLTLFSSICLLLGLFNDVLGLRTWLLEFGTPFENESPSLGKSKGVSESGNDDTGNALPDYPQEQPASVEGASRAAYRDRTAFDEAFEGQDPQKFLSYIRAEHLDTLPRSARVYISRTPARKARVAILLDEIGITKSLATFRFQKDFDVYTRPYELEVKLSFGGDFFGSGLTQAHFHGISNCLSSSLAISCEQAGECKDGEYYTIRALPKSDSDYSCSDFSVGGPEAREACNRLGEYVNSRMPFEGAAVLAKSGPARGYSSERFCQMHYDVEVLEAYLHP